MAHNWRQSFTNMVTRNYYNDGFDFMYPRIDMAGNETGIVGAEFPFFNFLAYLMDRIFGYYDWFGRLINLIVSSIGIYFFCRILEKKFTKTIAFNSGIILLCSIWFAYSRKVMPDTFSVSLVIIGLYCLYEYLSEKHIIPYILFFLFATLGALCKLPAIAFFIFFLLPLFSKKHDINIKINIIVASIAGVTLTGLWYFYWVPYLVSTYHYQLFFTKGFIEGFNEITAMIPGTLEKFYFSALKSYLAFACFLGGIYFMFRNSDKILRIGFVLFILVFILYILKTGIVFSTHGYYIIPFVPFMAMGAGFLISKFKIRIQIIILLLISIESIANQQDDFFIKKSMRYKLSLEAVADSVSAKTDLVIINGGEGPQELYFTNRKGWTVSDSVLENRSSIEKLRNKGAAYLFVDRSSFSGKIEGYPLTYTDDHFDVYKLRE